MRRRTVARATMECWPLAPRRSARRTSGFFAPLFFPRSFRPSSASAALPSQLRRRGELFPRAPPCASRSPPGLPCFPRFYSSISMFASCYLSPSPFLPPPSFLASPPPPSSLPSPPPPPPRRSSESLYFPTSKFSLKPNSAARVPGEAATTQPNWRLFQVIQDVRKDADVSALIAPHS